MSLGCAIDSYSVGSSTNYWSFCTTLARSSVKPWTEIIVRSLGNDQDLFGCSPPYLFS